MVSGAFLKILNGFWMFFFYNQSVQSFSNLCFVSKQIKINCDQDSTDLKKKFDLYPRAKKNWSGFVGKKMCDYGSENKNEKCVCGSWSGSKARTAVWRVTVSTLQVDLNGDGTIDFPEFLEMMKQKSSEADQVIRDRSQDNLGWGRLHSRTELRIRIRLDLGILVRFGSCLKKAWIQNV